jgi:hypothetical protein
MEMIRILAFWRNETNHYNKEKNQETKAQNTQ